MLRPRRDLDHRQLLIAIEPAREVQVHMPEPVAATLFNIRAKKRKQRTDFQRLENNLTKSVVGFVTSQFSSQSNLQLPGFRPSTPQQQLLIRLLDKARHLQ